MSPPPLVALRGVPLSGDEALAHEKHSAAGAVCLFLGTVRDHNDGRAVVKLEYEAYASMAVAEMSRIAEELVAEITDLRLAGLHRTGAWEVGAVAVVSAASAPHRGEAFQACRALIDRVKARVPIWKREHGPEGAYWVGWEDAAAAAMPTPTNTEDTHDALHHGARRCSLLARRAPSKPCPRLPRRPLNRHRRKTSSATRRSITITGSPGGAGEGYFAHLGGGRSVCDRDRVSSLARAPCLVPRGARRICVGRFADKFGLLVDPASQEAVPLGLHLTHHPRTRVPFVVMNCQLCHAERLRLPDGDRIVSGLGSTHVRVHAYDDAFVHIAHDASFTTENVLAAATKAARQHQIVWPDAVRLPIVQATVAGIRERVEARSLDAERLANGLPGRVATIESFAMALGMHGVHVPLPATIGWTKIPDVRGFPYRDTLSWDGVGTGSPVALAAEADFAFGARPLWFETHRHIATSLYLFLKRFDRHLAYSGSIDAPLAQHGREVFDGRCAKCHGYYAAEGPQPRVRYRERIVPVDVVGTDSARLDAVTPQFVAAANGVALARGVTTVAATGGYVPPVLLDVWARGTYGHIGQWPSIEVMAMGP